MKKHTYYFTHHNNVTDYLDNGERVIRRVPYTISDTDLGRLMKSISERMKNSEYDEEAVISWDGPEGIVLKRVKL